MKVKQYLPVLSICVSCILVLAGLTGCNTTKTTAWVITKTLSALSGVKSFNFATDVIDTNNYNSTTGTIEWKGSKITDISNRKMSMGMTITDTEPENNPEIFSLEMYLINGEDYQKDSAVGLYQPNPWTKTTMTGTLWNRETQIPFLTELLKTAVQVDSSGNEIVDGVDCYVLTITPSAQGAVDFAVSQEQPFGPQIDINWGGETPVVRPDAFASGSIQIWIARDNYLPVKVEINLDFQGDVGQIGGISISPSSSTPAANPVDSRFQGELDFSNYNQPVSIQVPQDALNAQNVGNYPRK
jgi:hypothetical protein